MLDQVLQAFSLTPDADLNLMRPDQTLGELTARLESVAEALKDTLFAYTVEGDHVDVTSPWGNLLRCYEPAPRFAGERKPTGRNSKWFERSPRRRS
jgi:hypothetical protein